ncbi:MAG: hypothetical protein WAU16_16250 [Rhizobiaceae bacterium]
MTYKDTILNKINRTAAKFELASGKKARNIYLGRYEMEALLKWAIDNQYNFKGSSIEGNNRPEVFGLLCFKVNSDSHMECA